MTESLAAGFSAQHWIAMLAIVAFAGLMHGFVGIGFPLFATPLLGLLFGFKAAVALLVLPTWVVTLCTVWAYRGNARLGDAARMHWPLPVMMPIGMFFGVWALHALDAGLLMLLMAAVLVVYLVLDRLGHTDLRFAKRHPVLLAVPFGLAAGFSEGAVNVAGPILLIYFLLLDLPVAAIVAVLNWMFLLGKSVQAVMMADRGAFGPLALQALVPLAAVGSAAFFGGLALRRRFDPERYRGWLKATLALLAIGLLLRVATGTGAM
jgi:uncharacterized protein